MDVLSSAIIISLILALLFLVYVTILVTAFVKHRPGELGNPRDYQWHFIVPCLNEQAVIGKTLDYLLSSFPQARLWVIDDGSDDSTLEITCAGRAGGGRITVLQRSLPDARCGKGEALNYAYQQISQHVGDADRSKAVCVVVDADGRPSSNLLDVCSGPALFGDAQVAAVQVEVRMSNRYRTEPLPGESAFANWLGRTFVRLQDIEFRGPISAMQMVRKFTHTVNVGGNGQLARLAALDSIDGRGGNPWGRALLEDYELGLRLMLNGWRNAYTIDSWVDQEALYSLGALIRQRTRWAQGSMQCLPYLRQIWSCRHFTNAGLGEVNYYLAQPWLQLIGSLAYPLPVLAFMSNAALYPLFVRRYLEDGGGLVLALYMVLGLAEFAVWGLLYRWRSERYLGWWQALGYGFALVAYNYLVYVIAWRALGRVLRRRDGWVKTQRIDALPATSA